MATITKQSEWLGCEEPQELGYFLRIHGKSDPSRFRWLAVEWLRRIRHWIDQDHLIWVDAFENWVHGGGDHPSTLQLPDIYLPFINHPPMSYFWVWLCMGDFPKVNSMMIAAFAGASASEDFPAFEPPARPNENLDYTKQHKSRSKKRNYVKVANTDADSAVWQAARDKWEAAKKKHHRKVAKEFCDQFRCVAGNPFREISLQPEWRTPTVMALTQGIDDASAFDRLPILADALEESGCDSVDILLHCRKPVSHFRGCWVIDSLLRRMS